MRNTLYSNERKTFDKDSVFAFITPRLLLTICYLLPITFLLLFYVYPLISIFTLSFAPKGHIDLVALQKLVSTNYHLKTLWFTIWQAALSTLLTLSLALPGAYVFARYHFPGKNLLRAVTTIPFVLPTIVVANAFTALLGPRGIINQTLMTLFKLDTPPLLVQHTMSLSRHTLQARTSYVRSQTGLAIF